MVGHSVNHDVHVHVYIDHYYPYYDRDTGELVGAKKRVVKTKQFSASGNHTNVGLFGQNLVLNVRLVLEYVREKQV